MQLVLPSAADKLVPAAAAEPAAAAAAPGSLAASVRAPPRVTELVYDAHAYIPGEVKIIEELPQRSAFSPFLRSGLADEALQQLWLPPPRFAVMSTSGVLEVTRRRPLEVLKVRARRRSSSTSQPSTCGQLLLMACRRTAMPVQAATVSTIQRKHRQPCTFANM
jgi:hypothetical protein